MRTISDILGSLIAARPIYGEAMAEDIVNFSALARKLKPDIEEELLEEVSEGAVVMALRRHAADITERAPSMERVLPIRNIIVRSGLTEVVFRNSSALHKTHQQLLRIAEDYDNPFMNFTQGLHETTFDIGDELVPHLDTLTCNEERIVTYDGLSAISVRFPDNSVLIPGVYYPCVKALAWERINVYQIISYFTEVTFVVHDADIERAFGIMKGLARSAG